MKKVDLLHTAILIIALMAGYSALQTFMGIFTAIGYYYSDIFSANTRGMGGSFLSILLYLLLLSGTCAALIKYGRRIAEKILQNEPEPSSDETATVELDRHNLIMVVLIGMGVFTLIEPLPHLVINLFELFRNRITTDQFRSRTVDSDTIAIELLKLTIGFFLIYAVPSITNFIEKKIPVKTEAGS